MPKQSVPSIQIRNDGLVGDRQNNLKHHGGPDRAVCLWSAEIIQALQAEGHPIAPEVLKVSLNLVLPREKQTVRKSIKTSSLSGFEKSKMETSQSLDFR